VCLVPSDPESAHRPLGDAGYLRVSTVPGLSDEIVTEGAPEVRSGVKLCRHGDEGAMATAVRPLVWVASASSGLLTTSDTVPVAFGSGNLAGFVSRKA
jgi:hypothetical protein